MTFLELEEFIQNRMRISHIYQPIMLTTLLQNDGEGDVEVIAKATLAKHMVGCS
jgi:ATP adenylyltransferase